jgi:ubiquinone/menaquinone biosynthesis C-methylase UbiE
MDAESDASKAGTGGAAVWALGDYHRFAKATIWERGAELVEACGISSGQRVLDVAAGSGNTAIQAAQAGADAVASDATAANFAAGRHEADELGVALEWVEADAQRLPFDDDTFDVITSSFGVMFAPDHRAAAAELTRVCRPGGTIGLLAFTPEGLFTEFLGALAAYAPEPEGDPPPLWGSEEHVRDLLGDRVSELDMTRGRYTERAASPAAYAALFRETFGPVVAIFQGLSADAERRADAERDLLAFAERANEGSPGGEAEYRYEYLRVLATP